MTHDVATIRSTATVAQAVSLMRERGWRSLMVDRLHEQDAYGMITEADIVYKVIAIGKDPQRVRVYEVMTKPCIVINPDLGVEYVARLFAEHGLLIAPVIRGELLGIISVSDILGKSDFLESPQAVILEQQLQDAIAYARELCNQDGVTPEECLAAWKRVDALQVEAAYQQSEPIAKTALEAYCEENPERLEAQQYEIWCSG